MPRHFVDNCCQLSDGMRCKHIDRFSCCTKNFLREESGVLRRKLVVVVATAHMLFYMLPATNLLPPTGQC